MQNSEAKTEKAAIEIAAAIILGAKIKKIEDGLSLKFPDKSVHHYIFRTQEGATEVLQRATKKAENWRCPQ